MEHAHKQRGSMGNNFDPVVKPSQHKSNKRSPCRGTDWGWWEDTFRTKIRAVLHSTSCLPYKRLLWCTNTRTSRYSQCASTSYFSSMYLRRSHKQDAHWDLAVLRLNCGWTIYQPLQEPLPTDGDVEMMVVGTLVTITMPAIHWREPTKLEQWWHVVK